MDPFETEHKEHSNRIKNLVIVGGLLLPLIAGATTFASIFWETATYGTLLVITITMAFGLASTIFVTNQLERYDRELAMEKRTSEALQQSIDNLVGTTATMLENQIKR